MCVSFICRVIIIMLVGLLDSYREYSVVEEDLCKTALSWVGRVVLRRVGLFLSVRG